MKPRNITHQDNNSLLKVQCSPIAERGFTALYTKKTKCIEQTSYPVFPGLDSPVQHISRAVSVRGLPVSKDAVVICYLTQGLGALLEKYG